ncbi:MAG TPA: DHH family phosphoesterase [Candidatus Nanoarchaeia archaeon]|nr:DHH family phosphoesterase [Candidatus Nanoarchaeia archaeon]
MDFKQSLEALVAKFKSIKGVVKIVGNLDSDGIAATSILIKAFENEKIKFAVSIVRQVDKNLLSELKNEDYPIVFFVDLGSDYLTLMEKELNNKQVFILDHHAPEKKETSLNFINPILFDIDGTKEISAAGIAYFFAKFLNEKNIELAYLALIGAIGDIQENNGFKSLNNEILEDAVSSGKIEVKNSLKMFGIHTKPLYKVLQYSTNPYLPEITGNERAAIQFLESIDIKPKENNLWRKMEHLSEEELKRLITSITLKRLGSDTEEELYGPIYLVNGESSESPTRDAKEFSTLLNCCGRLGKSSLGLGACLGNKKLKEKAIDLLTQYRNEIINALSWFYKNKGKENVIEEKGFVIINAEERIRDTLIGTLASLISKSNVYPDGTIIISMAHSLDDTTKISSRISGYAKSKMDLNNFMHEICSKLDGIGGGHKLAAGASIPQEKEAEFIKLAKQILEKNASEEVVA